MDIKAEGDVEVQVGPVKVKFSPTKQGLGFTKDHELVAHLKRLIYELGSLPGLSLPIAEEVVELGRLLKEMGLD